MSNDEFKNLLKKLDLTKKAFSELLGTSSQVVNNWNIVYLVESWLNLYIENKNCAELKKII